MPPVHSGIVPSLLPARSAPTGVRLLPSLSASADLPSAPVANTAPAISAASLACLNSVIEIPPTGFSERVFGDEGDEITVADQVELAGAEIVGVAQVQRPAIQIVCLDPDRKRFAPVDKVAARSRRSAVDVVIERDARRYRERGAECIVVVGARGNAITPRERRRKTVDLGFRV